MKNKYYHNFAICLLADFMYELTVIYVANIIMNLQKKLFKIGNLIQQIAYELACNLWLVIEKKNVEIFKLALLQKRTVMLNERLMVGIIVISFK